MFTAEDVSDPVSQVVAGGGLAVLPLADGLEADVERDGELLLGEADDLSLVADGLTPSLAEQEFVGAHKAILTALAAEFKTILTFVENSWRVVSRTEKEKKGECVLPLNSEQRSV